VIISIKKEVQNLKKTFQIIYQKNFIFNIYVFKVGYCV